MVDDVQVIVPGPDYRLGPRETALWESFGALFDLAVTMVGRDLALSIMASRLSREARRTLGTEGARDLFQGYAATMLDVR